MDETIRRAIADLSALAEAGDAGDAQRIREIIALLEGAVLMPDASPAGTEDPRADRPPAPAPSAG